MVRFVALAVGYWCVTHVLCTRLVTPILEAVPPPPPLRQSIFDVLHDAFDAVLAYGAHTLLAMIAVLLLAPASVLAGYLLHRRPTRRSTSLAFLVLVPAGAALHAVWDLLSPLHASGYLQLAAAILAIEIVIIGASGIGVGFSLAPTQPIASADTAPPASPAVPAGSAARSDSSAGPATPTP